MNVGLVSTRFAGTDGVTLESSKLAATLEEDGQTPVWFAGERGEHFKPGMTFPLAHFKDRDVQRLQEASFGGGALTPQTQRSVESLTQELKRALHRFVADFDIDVMLAENVLCLPMHLPLGLAVGQLVAETGLPAVAHHHDFGWERARFRRTAVPHLLETAFPPTLDNLRHVVIQSAAREELKRRRGLESAVLPNVMDFERGPATPGDGAAYRRAAGLQPQDVLLLQPTRVVPRKGIETTLQLAYELADDRVKVVVSHDDGDEGLEYGRFLRREAERLGVDLRFAPVAAESDGPTLADAYAAADLVCYPSRYEGFGNALLEAFFYRRPVLVNRYPVYARDIAPTGVSCIEIEDGELTGEAIKQAACWLEEPSRYQDAVEANYRIGHARFSFQVIRERLLPLVRLPSSGAAAP
ncbi:MAG TPA: glycosyltransferase family 4 protein [Actinomycetes bacterium]|jgi:glycosyltransferase involved in cell wall biosynthesis|nr:glycosyltransferase family 4 protein [Actinomycetes bacterium]